MSSAVHIPGRLVFLPTARTGSTAVERELLKIDGAYKSSRAHPRITEIADWDGLRITFIRNPMEVAISWWYHHTQYRRPLHEFIETYSDSSFTQDGLLFFYRPHADLVLHYEDGVEEQMNVILGLLDLPPIQTKRVNVIDDKRSPLDAFDDQALAALQDRFGEELAACGYPLASLHWSHLIWQRDGETLRVYDSAAIDATADDMQVHLRLKRML